jgi:hypothetical protein
VRDPERRLCAAEQLKLTPAVVSCQIKRLERLFGAPLFAGATETAVRVKLRAWPRRSETTRWAM